MSRLARLADRADGTLGRLYFRAIGVVIGAMTLGLGRVAVSAVETGQIIPALVLIPITLGGGALTVYCFRRTRRLSEVE